MSAFPLGVAVFMARVHFSKGAPQRGLCPLFAVCVAHSVHLTQCQCWLDSVSVHGMWFQWASESGENWVWLDVAVKGMVALCGHY